MCWLQNMNEQQQSNWLRAENSCNLKLIPICLMLHMKDQNGGEESPALTYLYK